MSIRDDVSAHLDCFVLRSTSLTISKSILPEPKSVWRGNEILSPSKSEDCSNGDYLQMHF